MSHRYTQLTLLVIATVLLYAGIHIYLAPFSRDPDVYVAASIEKEKRLRTHLGQRIILTGGSGLAMSMQSQYLEKASCRPVVNMGLHAALGLPFMLNETLPGVRAGDLVILCPEYEVGEGDPRLLAQLVDVNPTATDFLALPTISHQIRYRVQNTQRILLASFNKLLHINDQHPAYRRGVFSSEGDAQGHHGLPSATPLAEIGKIKQTQPEQNVRLINAFIDKAKDIGAHVVLTYPAYCQSGYAINVDNLKTLHDYYVKNVTCPIIGGPADFVMPDSLFYDTVFHASRTGAQLRTEKLAQLLGPSLEPERVQIPTNQSGQ